MRRAWSGSITDWYAVTGLLADGVRLGIGRETCVVEDIELTELGLDDEPLEGCGGTGGNDEGSGAKGAGCEEV